MKIRWLLDAQMHDGTGLTLEPGQVYDVPAALGQAWIAQGAAEAVVEETPVLPAPAGQEE
jgi:hypothetical protein